MIVFDSITIPNDLFCLTFIRLSTISIRPHNIPKIKQPGKFVIYISDKGIPKGSSKKKSNPTKRTVMTKLIVIVQ
jgi:hypothetical protein